MVETQDIYRAQLMTASHMTWWLIKQLETRRSALFQEAYNLGKIFKENEEIKSTASRNSELPARSAMQQKCNRRKFSTL